MSEKMKNKNEEIIRDILLKMNYDTSMTLNENVLVLEQKPDHLMPWQPDNPVNTGVPRSKMTSTDLVRGMKNASAARQGFLEELSKLTIDDWQHIADWIGLVPLIGDAVDVVNAAVYLVRSIIAYSDNEITKGQNLLIEFALSLVAVIPLAGTPVKLLLKNIPWSAFAKGGTELAQILAKNLEKLSPPLKKIIKDNLDDVISFITKKINSLKGLLSNNMVRRFPKIVSVLSESVKLLENIVKGLREMLKPIVTAGAKTVPKVVQKTAKTSAKVVKTGSKVGKQTVKWTGKILAAPPGSTWFKTIKNLSKEACGTQRKENEWAYQTFSKNIPLIGGMRYGNFVCDILSAFAWTSGPLGPLLASSIETQNAKAYYDDGEKGMAAMSFILGMLPVGGLVGRGLVKSLSKESAEVLLKSNFTYKFFNWLEGSGQLTLTSKEVKTIIEFAGTAEAKTLATKQYLKDLEKGLAHATTKAMELGVDFDILYGMRKMTLQVLSFSDFVLDLLARVGSILIAAKTIAPYIGELDREYEIKINKQMFVNFEKNALKKDSIVISNAGDTTIINVGTKGSGERTSTEVKNSPTFREIDSLKNLYYQD